MLWGWGGNRRPGGKQWQPTAGWMTHGHLRADCLYTGISSGSNARYRVWEAFTFTFTTDDRCTNPALRSLRLFFFHIRMCRLHALFHFYVLSEQWLLSFSDTLIVRVRVNMYSPGTYSCVFQMKLERVPMPKVMAALPNIGGTMCWTAQSLADAHCSSAVQCQYRRTQDLNAKWILRLAKFR